MKVDALWIVEPNIMEIRQVEIGPPKYDEVQIEIKACGVCAWDSYLYQGISNPKPHPYTFGHEGVGYVRAVGEGVISVKPGDKVFAASAENDMMMQFCNQKESCVSKIPDDTEDWGAWVAEPVVCVVNLLYKTKIKPGDRVVLVGAGYMGLLTLQGLGAYPVGEVVVFEKREDRRMMAKEYGFDVYDPYSPDGEAKINEIVEAGGYEIVIDFAATASGYELSSRMTKNTEGKLVLGTWHRSKMEFDGTNWHLNGVNILNLAPNSNAHFREMISATAALIKRGVYDTGKLVSHVADYHNAQSVFEKSIDKSDGYMKGIITF